MAKYPVIVGESTPLKQETLGKKHFHYHNVYTRKDMSRFGYLFSVIANPLIQEEWVVSVIDRYIEKAEKGAILMALKLTLRELNPEGDFFIGVISHKRLYFACSDRYKAFLSRKDELWHVNGESNDRCHWENTVQFGEYILSPGDKIAVVSENISEAVTEKTFSDILNEYTIQVAAKELAERAHEKDQLGQSEVLTLTLDFSAPQIIIPWKVIGTVAALALLGLFIFRAVKSQRAPGSALPVRDLPVSPNKGDSAVSVTYLQKNLPLESKIAWEKTFGKSVDASPVGTDEMLFIASKDKYLYAYKAQGSELAWRARMAYSMAAAPLVDSDALYIGTFKNLMYRLKKEDGSIEWRFKTGGRIVSEAVGDEELIYFGSEDGYIYAVRKKDGGEVWRYPTKNPVWTAPFIKGEMLYAGSLDHTVYALDKKTGKRIWSRTLGDKIYSTLFVTEEAVYVGCDDYKLYALNRMTGEVLWSFTAGKEIAGQIYADNHAVYFGSEDMNIYALDIKTGAVLWNKATNGVVRSGAVVHDGILYIGSYDGNLYALTAEKGDLVWKGSLSGPIQGKPCLWDGTVIAGDQKGMVRAFVTDTRQLKPQALGEE